LHAALHHCREKAGLGVEGVAVGGCKASKVACQYGCPAAVGRVGKCKHPVAGYSVSVHYVAVGGTRFHGYHAEVLFQPRQNGFVAASFYLFGPEVVVVIVAAQAGDADAYGILCPAYDAILPLGAVFEAEDQPGQHFGIHVGQLVRPDALYLVARGSGEATAFAYLESGEEGYGDSPSGGMAAYIGLVYPCAGQVETCGQANTGVSVAKVLLDACGAALLHAFMGFAFQHYVFHAAFAAELELGLRCAVGVYHQDVRPHDVQGGKEIQHSVALVDVGILDIADGFDHKEPFLFRVKGLVSLELQDGLV